jgi:hypothetical protein
MKTIQFYQIVIYLFFGTIASSQGGESEDSAAIDRAKKVASESQTSVKQLIELLKRPVLFGTLDTPQAEVDKTKELILLKREAIMHLSQLSQSDEVIETIISYLDDPMEYFCYGFREIEHDDAGPLPTPAMKSIASIGIRAVPFLIRKLVRSNDESGERFISRSLLMMNDKESVRAMLLYAFDHSKSKDEERKISDAIRRSTDLDLPPSRFGNDNKPSTILFSSRDFKKVEDREILGMGKIGM